MSHMKSCDRHRRSKEVCQVREKTVEEKGIVYGFKDERTGKVSVGPKLMSRSMLNLPVFHLLIQNLQKL